MRYRASVTISVEGHAYFEADSKEDAEEHAHCLLPDEITEEAQTVRVWGVVEAPRGERTRGGEK